MTTGNLMWPIFITKRADKKAEIDRRKAEAKAEAAEDYAADAIAFAAAAVQEGRK